MTLSAALLLGAGLLLAPRDTVVEARPGDRLTLRDYQGRVTVDTWDRDEVWVAWEDDEDPGIRIVRRGDALELEWAGRGRWEEGDLEIRAPSWIQLDLQGPDMEVEATGFRGNVSIRNLEGDIFLRDLAGEVVAYTADGEIEGRGITGAARLRSGDGDLTLIGCSGPLDLETVEGDLDLRDISAPRIHARTTDGEVDFSGGFSPGGTFEFYSHSGDMSFRLQEPLDLNARVVTYNGEFESEFSVQARGFQSGEALEFTLGSGGGVLSVESFDGDVRLLRWEQTRQPGGPR